MVMNTMHIASFWIMIMVVVTLESHDVSASSSSSYGTLLQCLGDTRCLWVDRDGHSAVEGHVVLNQLLEDEGLKQQDHDDHAAFRRNLQMHMHHMEAMHRYANRVNHTLSYAIGVHARHMYESALPKESISSLVDSDKSITASTQRGRKLRVADYMNWCDAKPGANPLNRNVCTSVKSQQECGSCWAFAAADSIETAVAIQANAQPVPLSPQQFLDCSTEKLQNTFSYCWAQNNGIPGSPWMKKNIQWASTNNGCDGGMTHAAFQYAAFEQTIGVVAELDLPYSEGDGGATIGQCELEGLKPAARISGWSQAVGLDCSVSSNPNELLKIALQAQSLSVAINSQGNFKNYKGGIYKCPNDGDFREHSMIDHALVLVGYGTDPDQGDYWILKNSYGPTWGEAGFMRLLADDKINCGVSVYPVKPEGAQTGNALLKVDDSGTLEFLGQPLSFWKNIGIIFSVTILVLIAMGVMHARNTRAVTGNRGHHDQSQEAI